MSGTNPFRRKAPEDQSFKPPSTPFDHIPLSSNPESGIPPIDTARAIKTKTVKTVRIISPHSAEEHDPIPDEVYDSSRKTLFSPPPDLASPESVTDESPEDPFAADSGSGIDEEETHPKNLAGATRNQQARQGVSDVPLNPFQKTLASRENQGSPGSGRLVPEQKPSGLPNATTKPQYDVEEFKKLLLTGEKTISNTSALASAPSVTFSQTQNGDSSSNTDTSSASRQSLFERASNIRPESPRTSRESSPSFEGQHSSEASEPQISKSKPATLAHRHGKSMQVDRPQTTSFDDPTISIHRSEEAIPSHLGQGTLINPSSPSDKNKALPPLPSMSTSSHTNSDEMRSRPESHIESKYGETNLNIQRKPAPVPPPSRRTRPISIGSVNSGRSLPISEEGTAEAMQIGSSPPSRSMNAPAPPPPRRSNTLRGDSASSVPTVASISSISDQSSQRDQSPTPSQKARTQLPLTRSPTILASKGSSRTSPASGSTSTASPQPPPPPPPRRRGSSQSSNHYTPSRLSGSYTMPVQERLRSDSNASSISQLPMTNIESNSDPKTEHKDVLADLTALQREVDELRGKMR